MDGECSNFQPLILLIVLLGFVRFDSFGRNGRGGNIFNLTCLIQFFFGEGDGRGEKQNPFKTHFFVFSKIIVFQRRWGYLFKIWLHCQNYLWIILKSQYYLYNNFYYYYYHYYYYVILSLVTTIIIIIGLYYPRNNFYYY